MHTYNNKITVYIFLIMLSLLLSSCSTTDTPSKPTPAETEKEVSYSPKEPISKNHPKDIPLNQYNKELKALMIEVNDEYLLVKKIKGATPDALNEHHSKIQSKLQEIRISNRKYYFHSSLDECLVTAHEYIISLNQAYRSNNIQEINNFTNLIDENISSFHELSKKIDSGQIPNDYYNKPAK